jgi:hypothetical protein
MCVISCITDNVRRKYWELPLYNVGKIYSGFIVSFVTILNIGLFALLKKSSDMNAGGHIVIAAGSAAFTTVHMSTYWSIKVFI